MQSHSPTTPFGRRSLTLAHVASQMVATARPPEKVVHKWKIFHAICTARPRLGVSERSLSVLNALLTFHPETALTGEDDLIVFPVQPSAHRCGRTACPLRRCAATSPSWSTLGLIIRRDSPNGKRYARKGNAGEIELAFGFDLSPLVVRSEEFEQPGGRHRSRGARAQACARADHAVPARHRQDDCHRHRGRRPDAQGRAGAGRLAGSPRRLPGNRRARFRGPPRGSSSSRSPTSCLSSPTTCSIFWKHTLNPRIRAPMSPSLSATYRIQIQTPLLILNLASKKAGRRELSQNLNHRESRKVRIRWEWC